MRIRSKGRYHFYATHKGAQISIDKEHDGRFYIIVTDHDGRHRYDGWTPKGVRTTREAKQEAIRGARL